MNRLRVPVLLLSLIAMMLAHATVCATTTTAFEAVKAPAKVGRYRVFEATLHNAKPYANKFAGVELIAAFLAPSGRRVAFQGFFDGDGKGGGDMTTGDVWKLRFMPDELGRWTYAWRWSDGTPGGEGSFECVAEGAGKGVLQAYKDNPHWFAYNGTEPVWIKSYYETGHGAIAQPLDWIVEHVYGEFVKRHYNHLQVNWLLSLCCFQQYYLDGPPPETPDLMLYDEGHPSSTMNLNVWRMMERNLGWLNDRNIGAHMFLGFEGGRNDFVGSDGAKYKGPRWDALSPEEKDFYVRYVVARLAPFANLAGWNFVWEVPGDREDYELGWARLIEKYDVFGHLRTYEDEMPRENEYRRPEYTFAAIENHAIATPDKGRSRLYNKDPWTHHIACLLAYKGKPVFMSEGNALWRRYWMERSGATQDDLRRSAWACATAGASFTWNGHLKEYELYAGGPTGLPFNDQNLFTASERYVDILADTMSNEVAFYRMNPHDELLSDHDAMRVYVLAEPGKQYLVFAPQGEPFSLKLDAGEYANNVWLDAKTGAKRTLKAVTAKGEAVSFTPPDRATDWVLILRNR